MPTKNKLAWATRTDPGGVRVPGRGVVDDVMGRPIFPASGTAFPGALWQRRPSRSTGAPVLTLWAAVVAQRLGFDEDEALTLGKAVAGLNAQAKGRRLGIFKPHEEKPKKAREKERGERFLIEVCGRPVPATNTDDGIRAVRGGKPIDPDSVRRYLEDKFGDDLKAVRVGDAEARQSLQAPGTRPRRLPAVRALPARHPGGQEGLGCQGRPGPGAA